MRIFEIQNPTTRSIVIVKASNPDTALETVNNKFIEEHEPEVSIESVIECDLCAGSCVIAYIGY